jgi:hypothetical protein
LLRSTVRVSPLLLNYVYARNLANADDRFIDYFGGPHVIVSSTGSNNSGMFEPTSTRIASCPSKAAAPKALGSSRCQPSSAISITPPFPTSDYTSATPGPPATRCVRRPPSNAGKVLPDFPQPAQTINGSAVAVQLFGSGAYRGVEYSSGHRDGATAVPTGISNIAVSLWRLRFGISAEARGLLSCQAFASL